MRHFPNRPEYRRSRGFSLIEMIVAIGIIGLLLALVLPAIQYSRESVRRAECKNHLRQIGIAVHSYAEAFGCFPANHFGLVTVNGSAMRVDDYSAHARLLPYYGLSTIYKSLDFGRNLNDLSTIGEVAEIPLLKCASDPAATGSKGSYCFSIGTVPVPLPVFVRSGAFPASVGLTPASIRDGLSNTVGVAEKLCGSGGNFDPIRDAVLVSPGASAIDEASAEFWIATCQSLTGAASWNRDHGSPWLVGSRMIYNHILPPNSPVVDCGELVTVPMFGIHTTRSFHSGSVNVMRMDGSSESINNSIDMRVWWALGTRAGND